MGRRSIKVVIPRKGSIRSKAKGLRSNLPSYLAAQKKLDDKLHAVRRNRRKSLEIIGSMKNLTLEKKQKGKAASSNTPGINSFRSFKLSNLTFVLMKFKRKLREAKLRNVTSEMSKKEKRRGSKFTETKLSGKTVA